MIKRFDDSGCIWSRFCYRIVRVFRKFHAIRPSRLSTPKSIGRSIDRNARNTWPWYFLPFRRNDDFIIIIYFYVPDSKSIYTVQAHTALSCRKWCQGARIDGHRLKIWGLSRTVSNMHAVDFGSDSGVSGRATMWDCPLIFVLFFVSLWSKIIGVLSMILCSYLVMFLLLLLNIRLTCIVFLLVTNFFQCRLEISVWIWSFFWTYLLLFHIINFVLLYCLNCWIWP